MFLRIQAVYANMCSSSNMCWNVSRKFRLHIVTSCRFEASRDPTLDRWQLAGEKSVEMDTIVLQCHYITAIFHYNYWKSFGRLFSDLVIHRHVYVLAFHSWILIGHLLPSTFARSVCQVQGIATCLARVRVHDVDHALGSVVINVKLKGLLSIKPYQALKRLIPAPYHWMELYELWNSASGWEPLQCGGPAAFSVQITQSHRGAYKQVPAGFHYSLPASGFLSAI